MIDFLCPSKKLRLKTSEELALPKAISKKNNYFQEKTEKNPTDSKKVLRIN